MVPALGRTALATTCAALAALAVTVAVRFTYITDSLYVLQGASTLLKCVEAGYLTRCESPIWQYSFYPLAQYVPAAALNPLGLGGPPAIHVLVWINFACFVGILLVVWSVASALAGRGPAAVAIIALLVGPLLFYADAAYGEMLAAFLTVMFVAVLLTGAPLWMTGFAFVCAGVTKDVAVPMLLLLSASILIGRWSEIEPRRRKQIVVTLALASVIALAINAGFNHLRYGQITNSVYGSAASNRIVPSYWPRYVLAALVSPNAGVVFEWPVAAAILLGGAVWSLRRLRGRLERWAALTPFILLLVVLVGFSAYYSPFGWYAWMNRFSVPWVPALVLVAVAGYPDVARGTLRALALRRRAFWAACAVACVFVFSQAGAVTAGQPHSFQWLFDSDKECPLRFPQLDPGSEQFRHCQVHVAWAKPPVTIKGIEAAVEPRGLALAILSALACLSLAAYARRKLLSRDERGTPTRPAPQTTAP